MERSSSGSSDFTVVVDNVPRDNLCNVTNISLFAIADPNQAANNNHVNSVSEVLPDSGTKTFYENLPFHGIQAPPNKVSIISSFHKNKKKRKKKTDSILSNRMSNTLDLQLAYYRGYRKKKIMTANVSVANKSNRKGTATETQISKIILRLETELKLR